MKAAHITLAVLVAASTQLTLRADEWNVVLLEPLGASESKCSAASGGVQGGWVRYNGQGQATIWFGGPDGFIDLSVGQTSWISSSVSALSGNQVAISTYTSQMGRAILYNRTTELFLDMTPPGMASAAFQGLDVGTNTQVGSGVLGMGAAVLWRGSPESVVNLTPPGWLSSAAAACAGDWQVGNGVANSMPYMGHPFITNGGQSFVDLTPYGAESAGVAGCDYSSQVGSVKWPWFPMGRAVLWRGTPASAVDLHPDFAASSAAAGCANGVQVGGYVPTTGGFGQAIMWRGSAVSALDLHHFVQEQLGYQYVQTEATGIDPTTGDIVGNAYTVAGAYLISHAIVWKRPSVAGDVTGDGWVNALDVAFLLNAWGGGGAADLNGDTRVDASDLAIMLAAWTG